MPRPNVDKYRPDQENPAQLEFLGAFSCPWTLNHNWPGYKAPPTETCPASTTACQPALSDP